MTLVKTKEVLSLKELNKRRSLLIVYLHENHSSALTITNPGIGNQMVTVKADGIIGGRTLLNGVVADMQSFGISTSDLNTVNQGVSLDWPEKVVELGFVEEARETPYEPVGNPVKSVSSVSSVTKTAPPNGAAKAPVILSLNELKKKKKELEILLVNNFGTRFSLNGLSEQGQHSFLSTSDKGSLGHAEEFLGKQGISFENLMPLSLSLKVKLNTVGDFDAIKETAAPKVDPSPASSNQNGSTTESIKSKEENGSAEEGEAEESSSVLRGVPKLTRSLKIQIGKKLKEKLEEENLEFTSTAPGENDKAMVFVSGEEGERAKKVLEKLGITKFGKVADSNKKTVKIFDLGQVAHLIGISVPTKRGFQKSNKGATKNTKKPAGSSPNGTSLTPSNLSKSDKRAIKNVVDGWLDEEKISFGYSSDPRADYVLKFGDSGDAERVKSLLKEKGVSEFGQTRKDYLVRIIDLSELRHHLSPGSPAAASPAPASASPVVAPAKSVASIDPSSLASEILGMFQDQGIILSRVTLSTKGNRIKTKAELVKSSELESLVEDVIKGHL